MARTTVPSGALIVLVAVMALTHPHCTHAENPHTLRGSNVAPGAFIWQGFDHRWERTMVGFSTPHRMGNFSNYIDSQDFSGLGLATVRQTFHVGVDGDFAHPLTGATAVKGGSVRATTASPKIDFQDSADRDSSHPSAETTREFSVAIPLEEAMQGLGTYAAVLRGIQVDMACVPDATNKCNSNGIWPHRMYVEVKDCAPEGEALKCTIHMDLFRSWTPTKGGLKPFNYVMEFSVTPHLSVLGGAKHEFAATDVPAIIRTSNIRAGPITETQDVSGVSGMIVGSMALRGFGFELKETDGYKKLGRYMERLMFRVVDGSYTQDTGSLQYKYMMEYNAPYTVINSDVEYYLLPTLLQFGKHGTYSVHSNFEAKGQVCISGLGFSCKMKGMVETNTNLVKIRAS